MSCPVPWAADDDAPVCARCGRPVPAAVDVCTPCLAVLEQLHLPAVRRDLARLELHLRFEAEYPVDREAGSTGQSFRQARPSRRRSARAAGGPQLPAE